MKIITISREFGSGGRELGKRLAEQLDMDYYDSEIITQIAEKRGLDEKYVEKTLNDHGWQEHTLSFRRTLSSAIYSQSVKVDLLLEQKKVIEEIAALGKDCVIVGRNADVILEKFEPFNIFVCADENAKLKRCIERADENEKLTEKELIRKMKSIDKARAQTREIIAGSEWGERSSYNITINTSGWEIKELVPAAADFAERWFGRN